jgi:hypothetical protein
MGLMIVERLYGLASQSRLGVQVRDKPIREQVSDTFPCMGT